jgi:acetyl esterase/lipase
MFARLLVAAAVAGGACAPAAAQPKGKGPKVPPGTLVKRDLAYGDHALNKLDLAVPPGAGPFPLVLWVHGGGWKQGSKDNPPIVGMLNHGYAVAATNYRLSQHAVFPAQIHDVKAAVRFLRTNAKAYNLAPDRFGVAGGSAGGHLVALLGTSAGVKDLEGEGHTGVGSEVQAVCDIFGPADLTRVAVKDNGAGMVTQLLGGPPGQKPALAKLASPVAHVGKGDPPFLIIHGAKDALVPVDQSKALDAALRKAGVESTLIVVPGADHNLEKVTPKAVRDRVVAFFDKHLKK